MRQELLDEGYIVGYGRRGEHTLLLKVQTEVA
jgi:hypothetical protein